MGCREGSPKGSLGWAPKVALPTPLGVVKAGGVAHRSGNAQEVEEGQLAWTTSGKGQTRVAKALGGPNEEDPDFRWRQLALDSMGDKELFKDI